MRNIIQKTIDNIGTNFAKELSDCKIDFDKIDEIKFSAEKPIRVYSKKQKIFESSFATSVFDINEIFSVFCEYSVHAYRKEISEGFITSEGGIRIGICGTAIYDDNKIIGIKYFSGLNIRIPHEIKNIASEIFSLTEEGGLLIIGPPNSGKTTLLRDFSRIASENKNLIIVDERNEISGSSKGIPYFDVGNSFVMNGFLKSDGIKIAVRSMSPEIIVCDEFGDEKDIVSAFFAMKSGAVIVASMHAQNSEDLKTKPLFDEIIKKRIFVNFVFLDKNFEIYKILKAEDFFEL